MWYVMRTSDLWMSRAGTWTKSILVVVITELAGMCYVPRVVLMPLVAALMAAESVVDVEEILR
jgi:hypothetical protein